MARRKLAFSVLLPLFAAVAVLVRRRWLLTVSVAFALSLLGLLTNIDELRYLPVFFIGTLMAVRLDSIQEWTRRRLRRPHARRWGIAWLSARSVYWSPTGVPSRSLHRERFPAAF